MTIIDNNEPPKPTGGGQPRSKLSIAVAKAAAELEASKSKKERRETALAAMLAADATPPAPEPEEGTNSDVSIAEDDNNFPAAKNPPSDIIQIQNGQEEQDIEEGVSNTLTITVTKQSPDDNLGFEYAQEPSTDCYFITSVASDGLCGQTGLQTGQEMLEINGISLRGMKKQRVRNLLFLLSSNSGREVTITVTSITKDIDDISDDWFPADIEAREREWRDGKVQMISSKDGWKVSRDMPSILANHMPATYWNNFCDELDDALMSFNDSEMLLRCFGAFFNVLALFVLFTSFAIIIRFTHWAFLFIYYLIWFAVWLYVEMKVDAIASDISSEMKKICHRATTQCPAIVLRVTTLPDLGDQVSRRVWSGQLVTKTAFNYLDYIEVSINRLGRNASPLRSSSSSSSNHRDIEAAEAVAVPTNTSTTTTAAPQMCRVELQTNSEIRSFLGTYAPNELHGYFTHEEWSRLDDKFTTVWNNNISRSCCNGKKKGLRAVATVLAKANKFILQDQY